MATKTANVNSRMSSTVKQQAEDILAKLGIPRSVAIDMFYRQIIAHNGIPFALTVAPKVLSRDEMTTTEFDRMMAAGLMQAKAEDSYSVEEVFNDLEGNA